MVFSFIVCFLCACADTKIPSYTDSSLYLFGDSLSDVGNANIASSGLLPDKNYYKGRFSNGPIYPDLLANKLSTPMKASRSFGSNYAFAGARSIDVNAQVSNYKHNVDDQADPAALYVIWSGANDLLDILQNPDSNSSIADAIAFIENAIRKLSAIGAQHIVVLNQINMSHLPRIVKLDQLVPGKTAEAAQLSNQFNSALVMMLDNLETTDNIKTLRLDVFTLFEEIIANPENYSFTNVSEACYQKDENSIELSGMEIICSNSNSYLFWDSLHPTTAGHAIIANNMYLTINN